MESQRQLSVDENISGYAKIEELNLSTPVHNVLMRSGVDTILKLISLSEDELLHLENGHLRPNGVQEIKSKIASLNIPGLKLGIDSNSEPYKKILELEKIMRLEEIKKLLISMDNLKDACLKSNLERKNEYLDMIKRIMTEIVAEIKKENYLELDISEFKFEADSNSESFDKTDELINLLIQINKLKEICLDSNMKINSEYLTSIKELIDTISSDLEHRKGNKL